MNPEQNPIEALMKQMHDLLDQLQLKKGSRIDMDKITPELLEQVEALQKKAKQIEKTSEEVVALSGLSREEMLNRLNGRADDISPESRRRIEAANQLNQRAVGLAASFGTQPDLVSQDSLPSSKGKTEFEKVQEDKKSRKKRSSKFKRFKGEQA